MLISCPKCHSIYEIPDNLIPRTGQNFRCQTCSNVWHAMRQDAIGYEEPAEEELYIEPIPVAEPPHRNYPANKKEFTILSDGKSGRKTRSSRQIIDEEGDENYIPPAPKVKKKKEITLTSDMGTSFTISAPQDEVEEAPAPHFGAETSSLKINATDRLLPTPTAFKGYKKTALLLWLVAIAAFALFFRREIVSVYPLAETYYQKIGLSGQNNPQYLRFKNIFVTETTTNDKPALRVEATIYNDSFYTTIVPNVTLADQKAAFAPARPLLKGHEQTTVEILLPQPEDFSTANLILGFQKP